MDLAKTIARRDKKLLSFESWYVLCWTVDDGPDFHFTEDIIWWSINKRTIIKSLFLSCYAMLVEKYKPHVWYVNVIRITIT